MTTTDQIKNKTLAAALACAAAGYGLDLAEIITEGKGCTRAAWARQSAIYLCARTGVYCRVIAENFGRSESAVYEAVRAVESRLSVPNWDKDWCASHAKAAAHFAKAGVSE